LLEELESRVRRFLIFILVMTPTQRAWPPFC